MLIRCFRKDRVDRAKARPADCGGYAAAGACPDAPAARPRGNSRPPGWTRCCCTGSASPPLRDRCSVCASSVLPPICGVRITLSRPRRGETNSSSPFGSFGKTSMRRAADLSGFERLRQRIDIHHRAARGIDQLRARLHPRQFARRRSCCASAASPGTCSVTTSAVSSSVFERRHLARIAQRQLRFDVVEDHPHARALRPARPPACRCGRSR